MTGWAIEALEELLDAVQQPGPPLSPEQVALMRDIIVELRGLDLPAPAVFRSDQGEDPPELSLSFLTSDLEIVLVVILRDGTVTRHFQTRRIRGLRKAPYGRWREAWIMDAALDVEAHQKRISR